MSGYFALHKLFSAYVSVSGDTEALPTSKILTAAEAVIGHIPLVNLVASDDRISPHRRSAHQAPEIALHITVSSSRRFSEGH